jgi:hypothetical protein
VEGIDFIQTYDAINERREHRRFARARREANPGESELEAFMRLYPNDDTDDLPWLPARYSDKFLRRLHSRLQL